jgi:AbrB family looped-hinge helix DNA binding protein
VSRITSKLQVTIPKAIAERYGIAPGDEISFVPAGDVLRVVPGVASAAPAIDVESRLRIFDQASARQALRQKRRPARRPRTDRGWTREELYDRGRTG